VDAIADAGGSPALTARLKDDELKLEALRTKVAVTQARRSRSRPKDGMQVARALLTEAAQLIGKDRETTRGALVAMLDPMKLTPANEGTVAFYDAEGMIKIPANQGVDREVLNKLSCGGSI
jgi:hypothetical protein